MTTAKELYDKVFGIINRHDNNKDEYDRVFEEINLIGSRGWEPFILLLSEVLTKKRSWPIDLSGSDMDSYLLYLADGENNGCKNIDKLNNQKSRDIFFNDALRLNLNIVCAFQDILDTETLNLVNDINSIAESLNLTVHKMDETGLWLAISKTGEIPDKDVEMIKNEKAESSPKEAEILRKYLLIKIGKWKGI